MKALAGLAALVAVLIGSSTLTRTPDAKPMAAVVTMTSDQSNDIPPYIHFDPSDWR